MGLTTQGGFASPLNDVENPGDCRLSALSSLVHWLAAVGSQDILHLQASCLWSKQKEEWRGWSQPACCFYQEIENSQITSPESPGHPLLWKKGGAAVVGLSIRVHSLCSEECGFLITRRFCGCGTFTFPFLSKSHNTYMDKSNIGNIDRDIIKMSQSTQGPSFLNWCDWSFKGLLPPKLLMLSININNWVLSFQYYFLEQDGLQISSRKNWLMLTLPDHQMCPSRYLRLNYDVSSSPSTYLGSSSPPLSACLEGY